MTTSNLENMELGEYLKMIRENLGYSTYDVNRLCDISPSYISLMENGKRKPSAIILKKLAPIYNLDYFDLYEKAGYIDLLPDEKREKYKTKEGLSFYGNSAIVFVYGTIPAGIPMECIEDILDTEEISADMLKGDKQYFGLRVKGNSMFPDYLDGDTLILEKVDDCESGEDCVVMVNGYDGTFKKVIKDPTAKTIRLQPINTSLGEDGRPLFEPITYTEEQIENLPVRIIGRVVELRRRKIK